MSRARTLSSLSKASGRLTFLESPQITIHPTVRGSGRSGSSEKPGELPTSLSLLEAVSWVQSGRIQSQPDGVAKPIADWLERWTERLSASELAEFKPLVGRLASATNPETRVYSILLWSDRTALNAWLGQLDADLQFSFSANQSFTATPERMTAQKRITRALEGLDDGGRQHKRVVDRALEACGLRSANDAITSWNRARPHRVHEWCEIRSKENLELCHGAATLLAAGAETESDAEAELQRCESELRRQTIASEVFGANPPSGLEA